jgi:hypothetical protein
MNSEIIDRIEREVTTEIAATIVAGGDLDALGEQAIIDESRKTGKAAALALRQIRQDYGGHEAHQRSARINHATHAVDKALTDKISGK